MSNYPKDLPTCSHGKQIWQRCLFCEEEQRSKETMNKEGEYKTQIERLLLALGWASDSEREGRMLPAELLILRRDMYNAYKVLGFTDEELKGTTLL